MIRFVKLISFTALMAVVLFAARNRQRTAENTLSPPAATTIKLGGSELDIDYNAPSARGRQVEGGLIPYGEWYRLGADAATTLTTATDIKIGDLRVPKGVHTLFLFATKDSWQLIVNNQTKQWGLSYNQKQDLGRINMKLSKLRAPVEQMRLVLAVTTPKSATLSLEWGTTRAEVPIAIE